MKILTFIPLKKLFLVPNTNHNTLTLQANISINVEIQSTKMF